MAKRGTEKAGTEREGEQAIGRLAIDRILPELIRRALDAGTATLTATDQVVRDLVGDAALPREVIGIVYDQIDETKNEILRAVAKEVRDVLEATDLTTELQKALTALSLEMKAEIRFIPNDQAVGGVRPDVRVQTARVKRSGDS